MVRLSCSVHVPGSRAHSRTLKFLASRVVTAAALVITGCLSRLDDSLLDRAPVERAEGGVGTAGPGSSSLPSEAMPTCHNDALDELETAIDCGGGACSACGLGLSCKVDNDCESRVCDGICVAQTCSNKDLDPGETATDCGGNCGACGTDQRCKVDADCLSKHCQGELCIAPSCSDEIQNGVEVGLDCGAESGCGACGDRVTCLADADCSSGLCQGVCASAQCGDTKRNGDETAIDCGGSCAGCKEGEACLEATDCISLSCDPSAELCLAPSCSDGVRNGKEADIDCGPGCLPCVEDATCVLASDCAESVCKPSTAHAGLVCFAARCDDKVRNGEETAIDCGPGCDACADGLTCETDADCASNSCLGVCQPATCDDGRLNQGESDVDCGGPCDLCAVGRACSDATACVSAVCSATGECAPAGTGSNCTEAGDCITGQCLPEGLCGAGGGGAACYAAVDCLSTSCLDSVCELGFSSADCGRDADCHSDNCVAAGCAAGETGDACLGVTDCFSGRCVDGACAALDMSIVSDGRKGMIDGVTVAVHVTIARGATPLTWNEFALLYFYSAESNTDLVHNMNSPYYSPQVPAGPTVKLVEVLPGNSVFVWQPHSTASVPQTAMLIDYLFHDVGFGAMNVANDYSYITPEGPNPKIVVCRKVGGIWGIAQGIPPQAIPDPCQYVESCSDVRCDEP